MPGYLFVGFMIAIGLLGVAVRNRVSLNVRRVILAVSTAIMAVAAFTDPRIEARAFSRCCSGSHSSWGLGDRPYLRRPRAIIGSSDRGLWSNHSFGRANHVGTPLFARDRWDRPRRNVSQPPRSVGAAPSNTHGVQYCDLDSRPPRPVASLCLIGRCGDWASECCALVAVSECTTVVMALPRIPGQAPNQGPIWLGPLRADLR